MKITGFAENLLGYASLNRACTAAAGVVLWGQRRAHLSRLEEVGGGRHVESVAIRLAESVNSGEAGKYGLGHGENDVP
uniref:Uncharacterized protein n=1 Tax=Oryza punctata TaxID=4537 RepID=A0A0E0LTL0_ORYPU